MQNYKNHTRLNPLHHFILTPIALALLVLSIIHFVQADTELSQKIFFVLIAFAILLGSLVSRMYGIKNQDRIIRLEMRQRYFELTGKSFSDKEKQLSLGQIIALRFAGDAEVLQLIDRAIMEKLPNKVIKKSIKYWQADYHRV